MINTLKNINEYYGNFTNLFNVNPKAVSVLELFGSEDALSKEWNEGIISEIFRSCIKTYNHDL